MSCFAPNMNQAVLNLISKFSTECTSISLHQAMKQSTRMNNKIALHNSKIRNALLIIMNNRCDMPLLYMNKIDIPLLHMKILIKRHISVNNRHALVYIYIYTILAKFKRLSSHNYQ